MSKFKIGQEVYFMDFSTPRKGNVKGIATIEGDFTSGGLNKSNQVVYAVEGCYSSLDEDKLFTSKEELNNHLFKDLK